MKKDKNLLEESWWSRNVIAFIITACVLLATVLVAAYALFNSKGPNFEFIGQSLLPLWGTWIGTVLAFYFGKANFEAATKSYQDAIKNLTPDEKIAKLLVKDTMLPLNKIIYLDYETEKSKPIDEILDYPQFKDYNRFAVLDKNKVVKYMIHRSTFFEFIYLKTVALKKESKNSDKEVLTLESLTSYNDDKIKNKLTRGIGFVSEDASMLDAKKVMDSIDECEDVFITQTGKPMEPILGLITNKMIFQKANV